MEICIFRPSVLWPMGEGGVVGLGVGKVSGREGFEGFIALTWTPVVYAGKQL